jgi:hypothetical protein
MKTLKRLFAVLLLTSLLSGCMSFTYNRLDWLIPWYVDGYVDLTRAQRQALQAHLAPRLDRHREEELANYLVLLEDIEADLDRPVQAATVRGWAEEVLAAAQRVERSLMEVALVFGAEVSNAQMREFIDGLWSRQHEYEEEFLQRSDTEYAEDDFENLSDFLQRFLGRLSDEQRAELREASRQLKRFDRAWLEERRAWLETLEPLILARGPGWQAAVMAAYEARLEERSPAYHAAFEHNLNMIAAAYAQALSTMSERQRAHAQREFSDLKQKLRKLMAQAEPTSKLGYSECTPVRATQCRHQAGGNHIADKPTGNHHDETSSADLQDHSSGKLPLGDGRHFPALTEHRSGGNGKAALDSPDNGRSIAGRLAGTVSRSHG